MSNNNSLWIIALIAWIGGSAWWHNCKIKMLCDEPVVVQAPLPAIEWPSLHIMDGADLMLHSPRHFSFAFSGDEANFSEVRTEIDSLTSYLKANPGKKLVITGDYSAQEHNSTSWPNLGIARAEKLKSYFTAQGLPADMFVTKGVRTDTPAPGTDSLRGGLSFTFTNTTELAENALAESQKFGTIFEPLDLYFNTGSTTYIKTEDNRQFIEEARKYLAENPGKKLLLTGHTDNTGNAGNNLELSRQRAREVLQELTAAGLPADQLTADAKGQSQPKAPNTTPEGRAANRRVSIVVK